MNLAFQSCPNVFKHERSWIGSLFRVRAVTFLRAAVSLVLAMALVYGCGKENKDVA